MPVDENIPEKSAAGTPPPTPARLAGRPNRQANYGEQPPAFHDENGGQFDAEDMEFFGSGSNFRPLGQQIVRNLKQKPK